MPLKWGDFNKSEDAAHNLKVAGSNPAPATKIPRGIKGLSAALRGGVCVSNTRGSTVEAREREVLRDDAQPETAHSALSGPSTASR